MSEVTDSELHELADTPPTAYRILFLAADGRIAATETVTAPDDARVLGLVQAKMGGSAVEVWEGLRFIKHFEAKDKPRA